MRRGNLTCALLCGALSLSVLAGGARAVAKPDPGNRWVADEAGVLGTETEQYIAQSNETLFDACGGEIVVVAVDFMDGLSSADYAMEVAENWNGVGDAELDNGCILVYAVGENKVRAMAGSGIEDSLTASHLEDLLTEYFYDDYDAGEYDTATRHMFDGLLGWYRDYYGLGAMGTPVDPVEPEPEYLPVESEPESVSDWLLSMVPLFVLLFVILVALDLNRYHRYRSRYCRPGMPVPPVLFRPFIFGWGGRRYYRTHGTYPVFTPRATPTRSASSRTRGGSFRGGGAGRNGTSYRSSFRGSSHRSSRSSGSFHRGGSFRGGGAGRG